jgi:hypothetical protein
MTHPVPDTASTKLAVWQAAQAELVALEQELVEAMADYGRTLDEPPRRLIIAIERKREEVQALFDIAIEALDALSIAKTGHTNFGRLS